MTKELQAIVIKETEEGMKKYDSDILLAEHLRREFENRFTNSIWHCIIGRNFAANITFEAGYHISFDYGPKSILLFKTI